MNHIGLKFKMSESKDEAINVREMVHSNIFMYALITFKF